METDLLLSASANVPYLIRPDLYYSHLPGATGIKTLISLYYVSHTKKWVQGITVKCYICKYWHKG